MLKNNEDSGSEMRNFKSMFFVYDKVSFKW